MARKEEQTVTNLRVKDVVLGQLVQCATDNDYGYEIVDHQKGNASEITEAYTLVFKVHACGEEMLQFVENLKDLLPNKSSTHEILATDYTLKSDVTEFLIILKYTLNELPNRIKDEDMLP